MSDGSKSLTGLFVGLQEHFWAKKGVPARRSDVEMCQRYVEVRGLDRVAPRPDVEVRRFRVEVRQFDSAAFHFDVVLRRKPVAKCLRDVELRQKTVELGRRDVLPSHCHGSPPKNLTAAA